MIGESKIMADMTTSVTAAEVRMALNDMPTGIVTDDLIDMKIMEAEHTLNKERGANCSQLTFDIAVRAEAAWKTYSAFVVNYEMTTKAAFESGREIMDYLEGDAVVKKGYAARSTTGTGIPATIHDNAKASSSMLDWYASEGRTALDLER